ncbi:MAG TPA: 2,3-diphosphoglycerate-dependent phosphoglycerate mutase [Bryobacteraceae bacterium]|nr:2,3-diphosphoglycerate-dependent phosphoglycerate mutase [Bryobacteraceae bacterium]
MHTLILLRHGESEWNKTNRFTGWTDVDLTARGCEEAWKAGQALKSAGLDFEVAYTSVLKRAIRTLWIVLDEMDRMWTPVHLCWQLNERHYGALQGLNKGDVETKYGQEQLKRWRRSFDIAPPRLTREDERYPGHDRRYRHLQPDQMPLGESLKDTAMRLWPCWQHSIALALREHRSVLVVAHGNSLRALVKHLDNISDSAIADVEIPTGRPLVYELDSDLEPIRRAYLSVSQGLEDRNPPQVGQAGHRDSTMAL